MNIEINNVEDLKEIILKYDFTRSKINDITFSTIGVFFDYENKEDLINQIDDIMLKHPTGRRPIFGDNCFNWIMNKQPMQFNSLKEVYSALDQNIIAPPQAITIVSKAFKMIEFNIESETLIKQQVLTQIKNIEFLKKEFKSVPIYFWQQSENFNIKDIFKSNN